MFKLMGKKVFQILLLTFLLNWPDEMPNYFTCSLTLGLHYIARPSGLHYDHYVSLARPFNMYYNLARPWCLHFYHYVSPSVVS